MVDETPDPRPDELESLLAAVSEGIAALVAWDIGRFEQALEHQREICARLALRPPAGCPANAAKAREVRELGKVYDRLLRHSTRWARTVREILEAGRGTRGAGTLSLRG